MVKEKTAKTEVEYSKPSASVQELFQTCPNCKGDLLVKQQTEKELKYRCDDCGYEETRKRE
jgi:predicted RNA-binding Zn-ribbon protein involved in translation (DUF1610 family)